MSDDLNLNSIDRYRKQSKRLILEEHSHCEVPAGCGGIVLRWSRGDEGIPVEMRVSHLGEAALHCAGEVRGNGRFVAPFGPGVIAIHLTERDLSVDWLIVATRHRSASWRLDQRIIPEMSTMDHQVWLATTEPPRGPWTSLAFDDSQWTPLAASATPADELDEKHRWRFYRDNGEVALGLPTAKEVWLRKRYDLSL